MPPDIKDEAVKIRVSKAMKTTIRRLADARIEAGQTSSEGAIFREAMVEYLGNRGISVQETPVNYRKKKPPGSNSSSEKGTDHKIAKIIREGTSGSKPGGEIPPGAKR